MVPATSQYRPPGPSASTKMPAATNGSMPPCATTTRSMKGLRRSGSMVAQFLSRSDWMTTIHPQATSATTRISAPISVVPCPGTSSNVDAVSTATSRIRASAARPAKPELGSETIFCRLMETPTNTSPVRTPAAPAWARKKSCQSCICPSSLETPFVGRIAQGQLTGQAQACSRICVNRMVWGIERRQAPAPLVDVGWRIPRSYGRSEGEHLETQRIGAHDRARRARLSYGGSRGPEALRVLRRPGVGGDQRLYGDARHASGASLGLPGGTLGVRGWRSHDSGALQPPRPARGHSVHVYGHEESPLGQADLGYRGRCRTTRSQHCDLHGPHDPRARRVLPRSAPGDSSAGLARTRRPGRHHTHHALLRTRLRRGA